ncbi:MAG: MAPEG family protein [Rhizobacter sp.]
MSAELYWLSLSLAATALFCFPYVLNRIAVRGLAGTLSNPSPDDPPLAAWAQRAQRAHANAVENLVLFAPAALAVHVLHRGDGLTAAACAIFFVSRLVHYVVYTAGIAGLRTLAFFGGWVGIALLVLRLLGIA